MESQGLGQDFTTNVIAAIGPNTSPRLRTIMASFIQHIHDFAREVDLTMDEWLAGVEMINWAGRMSDEKRNEGTLLCDIIGLESLVDDITARKAAKGGGKTTDTAVLGPFWRADAPVRQNGEDISSNTPADASPVYIHGRVMDASTGQPLPNASVDVWQASTNGLYEQQDPGQVEHNLRGKFITDEHGRYSFYALRPTVYPIPDDGPGGKLLKLLGRHGYRPAHIHFVIEKTGYRTLTTQLFDRESAYLDDDAVFAVKDTLRVDFTPRQGDASANLELEYDIQLGEE